MAITKAQTVAHIVAYALVRGVLDDVKPCDGDESAQADEIAFTETMAALEKKGEPNNG